MINTEKNEKLFNQVKSHLPENFPSFCQFHDFGYKCDVLVTSQLRLLKKLLKLPTQ